ncbi:MAG TPA: 2-oxo-4-hydroxy-4-carboxy-5-ureidoimidazoline decarboxylase [Pseudolabrys sp.]|nr:2-oxo-4-hydroxy-4-carboxy-5-ureidoimidazoline decarboxylase [Pseudolabrys sp.]
MTAQAPISLERLNAARQEDFVAALGAIYEHSPWVAEVALARRPFASLADLHECMSAAVTGADHARQLALINHHPDLAGKAARAGSLTADSKAEQHGAGLDALSEREFNEFQRLNDAYRRKFGFPFVICVLRHTKQSVLRQLDLRGKNDTPTERANALKEVIRIAALRLDRRVTAQDRLKIHGRLSTHVLDTCHGRPAQGVSLELRELSEPGSGRLMTAAVTNADGRTDRALISDRPVPIGSYELRFAVGDYFRRSGIVLPDPPFLDIVSVQFSIAEPEGHYHVPLLLTPWSYSTYRGS